MLKFEATIMVFLIAIICYFAEYPIWVFISASSMACVGYLIYSISTDRYELSSLEIIRLGACPTCHHKSLAVGADGWEDDLSADAIWQTTNLNCLKCGSHFRVFRGSGDDVVRVQATHGTILKDDGL